MNFQFYLEKLMNSREFQKFKKENPSAFLCSGFFAIDKTVPSKNKKADNQQHLDFFIPELKKMFSVKLELGKEVEILAVDNFKNDFNFKKIPDNLDFEFEEIEKIILKKMQEEKINKKIEKILLSLQTGKEGKKSFLIGTIFISNLGMIKVSYDIDERKLLDFQKKSFFDFLKVVKKN